MEHIDEAEETAREVLEIERRLGADGDQESAGSRVSSGLGALCSVAGTQMKGEAELAQSKQTEAEALPRSVLVDLRDRGAPATKGGRLNRVRRGPFGTALRGIQPGGRLRERGRLDEPRQSFTPPLRMRAVSVSRISSAGAQGVERYSATR